MSTSTSRVVARCRECGRRLAVAPERELPSCPACSGDLELDASVSLTASRDLPGTSTCSECAAINPPGLHYCVECGATLDVDDSVVASEAALRLRREAGSTLKRAYRWIALIRLGYRLGGVAYAVATLFAVIALGDLAVPVGQGLLVVGLTASMSAAMFMGAIHLLFRPFAWTLALAIVATGVSVVHFVGPNPYGVASWASALWAAVAWAGLVSAFRFRRLIETHRDLYITHHASSRTLRSLKGRTAHERHERLLRAMRNAGLRAWKVSALAAVAIVVATAVGAWTVVERVRPPRLETSLVAFEDAWARGDLTAIEGLFDERVRAVEHARLVGRIAGHGWSSALPELGPSELARAGDEATRTYRLAGIDEPLEVSWLLVERAWAITAARLAIPPFEPVLARFVAAWESSDPAAIAAFFAPDARADMERGIAEAKAGRGWAEFPELPEPRLSLPTDDRARATFRVGYGELETEWHFRDEGVWRLHALRMPRRIRGR